MAESGQHVDPDIGKAVLVQVTVDAVDDLFWTQRYNCADVDSGRRLARDDERDRTGSGSQEPAAQSGDIKGRTVQVVDQRIQAVHPALNVRYVLGSAQWQDVAPVLVLRPLGNLGQHAPFPCPQSFAALPDALELGDRTALSVLIHQARQRLGQAEG